MSLFSLEDSHQRSKQRRLGSGVESLEDRVLMAADAAPSIAYNTAAEVGAVLEDTRAVIVPSIHAYANSGGWEVFLEYTDLPEGLMFRRGSEVLHPEAGDGRIYFTLTDDGSHAVEIVGSDGNTLHTLAHTRSGGGRGGTTFDRTLNLSEFKRFNTSVGSTDTLKVTIPALHMYATQGGWEVFIEYAGFPQGIIFRRGKEVLQPDPGKGKVYFTLTDDGLHPIEMLDPQGNVLHLLGYSRSGGGRNGTDIDKALSIPELRREESITPIGITIPEAPRFAPELEIETTQTLEEGSREQQEEGSIALAVSQWLEEQGEIIESLDEQQPEQVQMREKTIWPRIRMKTASGSWGVDVSYKHIEGGGTLSLGDTTVSMDGQDGEVHLPMPSRSGGHYVVYVSPDGNRDELLMVHSNGGRSAKTLEHTKEYPKQVVTMRRSVEPQMVTPALRVTAPRGGDGLAVQYENMPPGASIVIGDREYLLDPQRKSMHLHVPQRAARYEARLFGVDGTMTPLLTIRTDWNRRITSSTQIVDPNLDDWRHDENDWFDIGRESNELHNVEPHLSVLEARAGTALLAVRSPYNQSFVVLDDERGLFSSQRIEHVGGTDFSMVKISMNADRPSGQYKLVLKGGNTMKTLVWIPLHWDQGRGELSNPDAQNDTPHDLRAEKSDVLRPSQHAFLEHMQLSNIDTLGTSIERIQGVRLYRKSPFFVSTDDARSYLEKTRSHVFVPDLDAYVRERMLVESNSFTNIRDRILRQQSDYMAIFSENLGHYEQAMGEVMQKGMELIVDVRNGRSEREAREELQKQIERAKRVQGVIELQAQSGITIPSADEVIAACVDLEEESFEDLIRVQNKVVSLRAREQNRKNDAEHQRSIAEEDREVLDTFLRDVQEQIRNVSDSSSQVQAEETEVVLTSAAVEGARTTIALSTDDETRLRTLANASGLPEGIWIIGHEVIANRWHTAILMNEDTSSLCDSWNEHCLENSMNKKTLSAAAGVGPLARLKSIVNRPSDNPDTHTNYFVSEVTLPDGMTLQQAIQNLLLADAAYDDNAHYDARAKWGEYNCNSYVAGVLHAAGITLPTLPDTILVPGYNNPVPIVSDAQ